MLQLPNSRTLLLSSGGYCSTSSTRVERSSSRTATSRTSAPPSGAAGSSTVTATDSNATSITASIEIDFTPLPTITTTSLAATTEGAPYDQTIAVSGGTGTITLSLGVAALMPGENPDALVERAASLLADATTTERLVARAAMNGERSDPAVWRDMFPTLFGAAAEPALRQRAAAVLEVSLAGADRGAHTRS